MRSDDGAGVVDQLIADHDDVVDIAGRIDDAMPGAERARGASDFQQGRCDLTVILGVL
ncbi:hypothetical protein GCM10009632_40100 [Mycolicibacterium alvei]|uniref:Uncharacterized protein n=1 Tax=Mycolicibacterium alvei TaxID=67081 RepID=A0A6N4UU11_9MYCO|nr:hypothetical protein MALV_20170 [Mycolicibacterium alvei]